MSGANETTFELGNTERQLDAGWAFARRLMNDRDQRRTELHQAAFKFHHHYMILHGVAVKYLVAPETPDQEMLEEHKKFSEALKSEGELLVNQLEAEGIDLPEPYSIEKIKGLLWKIDWDYGVWHKRNLTDERCQEILDAAFAPQESV